MNILVINGPNINMLGIREPHIYGKGTYNNLKEQIELWAAELGFNVEIFQSNHEGLIVDKIQAALNSADGIIINPAAYTHTSVAILDALKAVNIATVEVHLSSIEKRESFRQFSYISLYANKTISGKGFEGYKLALEWFKLNNNQ